MRPSRGAGGTLGVRDPRAADQPGVPARRPRLPGLPAGDWTRRTSTRAAAPSAAPPLPAAALAAAVVHARRRPRRRPARPHGGVPRPLGIARRLERLRWPTRAGSSCGRATRRHAVVVRADGRISVGDESEAFTVLPIASGDYLVTQGGHAWRVAVAGPPDARWVSARGSTVCVDVRAGRPVRRAAHARGDRRPVRADARHRDRDRRRRRASRCTPATSC